jgi:dihydrofolate synthase/folylpolyglutamate synthase
MVAAILQKAGYKTGLYTSPHLKDFRERIRVNGQMIGKDEVINWVGDFIAKNSDWKIEPSFFELTVAMAFDYFSQKNVDIAVIEVGLGGRLDSTNIITPEVGIITNIGFDHTALLGNTLPEIAFEKAGIIKSNVPVIIGQTQTETKEVFLNKAHEFNSPIYFADQQYITEYSMLGINSKQICHVKNMLGQDFPELKIGLLGGYQRKNLPAVLKACDILNENGWQVLKEDIYKGLSEVVELTGLMGRWQIIGHNPMVVCDTGHNEDGIKAVVAQIRNTAYRNLHFVFGAVNDKDLSKILMILPKDAIYYFTKADIPRALCELELMEKAVGYGLRGRAFKNVKEAFSAAKHAAEKNDLVVIGGSTFIVGEIL